MFQSNSARLWLHALDQERIIHCTNKEPFLHHAEEGSVGAASDLGALLWFGDWGGHRGIQHNEEGSGVCEASNYFYPHGPSNVE
jgi:hypothetical protein